MAPGENEFDTPGLEAYDITFLSFAILSRDTELSLGSLFHWAVVILAPEGPPPKVTSWHNLSVASIDADFQFSFGYQKLLYF